MEYLERFVDALAAIFQDAGLWLIFGFFIAGLLQAFVKKELLAKHLGRPGVGSVFKASLIGVPLPLCSCSVIPAAASLRESGASKGASAAFAVSTPEIDVPAFSLTWALLGPIMAAARVIAAGVSAILVGIMIDATDRPDSQPPKSAPNPTSAAAPAAPCCSGHADPSDGALLGSRIKTALRYGFITLPQDLAMWLLIGLFISAAVSAFVPSSWLAGSAGTGLPAMLAALALGLVIYICATGSTPMAAALVAKGLGPGAALVFLLAGPATNPATMAWILKDLGSRALVVYLTTIGVIAIASGLALEWVLNGTSLTGHLVAGHEHASTAQVIGGAILAAILTYALVRKLATKFGCTTTTSCCSTDSAPSEPASCRSSGECHCHQS